MHSPSDLLHLFEKALADENITKHPQGLYDPVNYILSLGGKRIRPVITMMSTEMCGGMPEKALPAALGLEMFHNFTLVHDDIMDNAPIRRGKGTVHEKWNANAAILSGDTMMVLAYEYFLRLDEPLVIPAVTLFSKTAKEVCEGQQLDMDFESEAEVSIDDYLEMIRLKTAVLLGASFRMGALLAGADEKIQQDLYDFGLSTGLAFQLMDDLLDTYGNEELFGKRLYGDIRANKKTFLYVKAIEKADNQQKKSLGNYYGRQDLPVEEKIEGVLGIYDELGIKAEIISMIDCFHGQALNCFKRIPFEEERKKVILGYTEKLMSRNY